MKYEQINFVIDVYQLFPIDVIQNNIDDVEFIFFGYPEISIDEKMTQIRNYSSPGSWTEEMPDKKLRLIIQTYIAESKIMRKQCVENNLTFIDMSYDFTSSLGKAIELIKG